MRVEQYCLFVKLLQLLVRFAFILLEQHYIDPSLEDTHAVDKHISYLRETGSWDIAEEPNSVSRNGTSTERKYSPT